MTGGTSTSGTSTGELTTTGATSTTSGTTDGTSGGVIDTTGGTTTTGGSDTTTTGSKDGGGAFVYNPKTKTAQWIDGLNGPYTYSDMTGYALRNVAPQ